MMIINKKKRVKLKNKIVLPSTRTSYIKSTNLSFTVPTKNV